MDMQLISPISQAVATFAGAIFVLVGIWLKDKLENRSKAKNAKVQIVAEIKALLDLIELNGYLPALQEIIADRKNGGNRSFYFPSSRSFTSVYEANLSNLGLLEHSASDVVRFYMIINSAVEDKDSIANFMKQRKELQESGKPLESSIDLNLVRFHEMIYGKFSTAVHIGEKLVEELRLETGRSRKARKPNRAATIVELDGVQESLEKTLANAGLAEQTSR
jgi:hypothetical protein